MGEEWEWKMNDEFLGYEKGDGIDSNTLTKIIIKYIIIWFIIMLFLFSRARAKGIIDKPNITHFVIVAIILIIPASLEINYNNKNMKESQTDENKLYTLARYIHNRFIKNDDYVEDNDEDNESKCKYNQVYCGNNICADTIKDCFDKEKDSESDEEEEEDYCANHSNPCFNGGQCKNKGNTYECINCNEGWNGIDCNSTNKYKIDPKCKINGENQANIIFCDTLNSCTSKNNCPNNELLWCKSNETLYDTRSEWIHNCPEHPEHPDYCTEKDINYNEDECINWRNKCTINSIYPNNNKEEICLKHKQCKFINNECKFKD